MRRLERGGSWIDRSRPIVFRFDGTEYEGLEGDTLASALLANGVRTGFRSPISGRPRGVMTDGPEEPNAFVAVLQPSLDVIAPATTVGLVAGLVAESRAGVADLADAARGHDRRPRHRHRRVETLVIGGGPTGMRVTRTAAAAGDRVMIVDERSRLDADTPEGPGVVAMTDATALGVYDDGYVVIHERSSEGHTLWHVRADDVILATGATERPLAFVGNDLPGVMLSSAAMRYTERFGVQPGGRAVAFITNDWGRQAAEAVAGAGSDLIDVIDVREGRHVVAAEGGERLERVVVRDASGSETTREIDLLLLSGGWNPNLTLWRAIGGGLTYDEARATFVPTGHGPRWLGVVGAAAGELPESTPFWWVQDGDDASKFVDLQRDQTVADVRSAVDSGLRSVEHVKRATYIGTAIDQGRTSGVVAAEIVNALLGESPGWQGPSNARPPTTPVSFATVAGPYRGDLLDPIRTTPMHAWHVEHGAVFEDVGQWKRPWYFPRD
ncbi:MAG TPA: 2Fe-2S iron-sulfur cluster-binding protein, partial [Actinomycetota bacterium]|nr:2Fe-2S iron-sulfur cluster-binding protein [Actinomycetota bacterium]